jgi:hypothetical protein
VSEVLSAFRWLLFGGSLLVWGRQMWRVLVRGVKPSLERLFLLALYAAFGLIVAISIPLDFTGVYAGTNFELRNFTDFALLAAPLLALGAHDWLTKLRAPRQDGTTRVHAVAQFEKSRSPWIQRLSGVLLASLIAVGLLKCTVDPLVSNEWIFYTPAERQSIDFFWGHAQAAALWSGADNRLANGATDRYTQNPHHDQIGGFALKPWERDWLRSAQIGANAAAQRSPLPPYQHQNRVYDDGGAQIYRQAPHTPFQK